jgi:hypothetical protein
MALSCETKDQIFTIAGKDYSYNMLRALIYEGKLDQIIAAVERGIGTILTGKGEAGNLTNASDMDAMTSLLDSADGNNAFGVSNAAIIRQVINAYNSLVANGKGYDESTGAGNRIFVASNHSDYTAAVNEALKAGGGSQQLSRGYIVERKDSKGNVVGRDIFISLEAASMLTVAHEVAHLYLAEAFGEDPKLFAAFVDEMSKVISESDLAYLKNFIQKYKDEEIRPEEFLAEMSGIISRTIAKGSLTQGEKTVIDKIVDLINKFLSQITGGRLGQKIEKKDIGAVQEFFEAMAGSVATGEAFNQALAQAAKEQVTQKPKKDAVQEPTTAEMGAQPSRTEGPRKEGGGGVRPGVEGTEAAQAGGEQAEVTLPATTETISSPADITAKEQKILAVYDDTGFITSDSWAAALANNRQYLDKVIESILKAREVLKNGKVTTRGAASAYLITVASVGSAGTKYEEWSKKHGKKLSSAFIENKKGVEWLRPEGIAAAYLSTEKGKKLLDAIDSNTATEKQVRDFTSFIGLGYENSKTEDIMKTLKSGGIKQMTDLFNTNKGSDFDQLYKGAMDTLYGIGTGKTGFFNQFLGVASRGVVDAREYNAWIAGVMKLSNAQKEFREKAESSPELQAILLERIKEVGLKLGYSEDIAAYIAHHAIWDAVANEVNTHTAEYEVVLRNLGITNEGISLLVEDVQGLLTEPGPLPIGGLIQNAPAKTKRKPSGKASSLTDVLIIDPKKLSGTKASITMSDHTKVGNYTNPKTGVVVKGLKGGVLYSYIDGIRKAGIVWASTTQAKARALVKGADGKNYCLVYRMNKATGSLGNKDFMMVAMAEIKAPFKTKEQKQQLLEKLNQRLGQFDQGVKLLSSNNGEFKSIEDFENAVDNLTFAERGKLWGTSDDGLLKVNYLPVENRHKMKDWFRFLAENNVPDKTEIVEHIQEEFIKQANDQDIVAVLKIAKPEYTDKERIIVYTTDKNLEDKKNGVYYIDAPHHQSYPYVVKGEPVGITEYFARVDEYYPALKDHPEFEGIRKSGSYYKAVETKAPIVSEIQGKLPEVSKTERRPVYKEQKLPNTVVVDGKTVPTTNNEGVQIFDNEQGVKKFWRWYSESNQLEDGKPIVWMHGTAERFEEFKPKQANAVFLTRNEEFAGGFSNMSFDWMAAHPDKFFDKQTLLSMYDGAIKYAKDIYTGYTKYQKLDKKARELAGQIRKEHGGISFGVKDSELHSEYYSVIDQMNKLSDSGVLDADYLDLTEKDGYDNTVRLINRAKDNTLNNTSPGKLPPAFNNFIRDQIPGKPVVLRLYANTKNPFDYQNPQHVESVVNTMRDFKNAGEYESRSIEMGDKSTQSFDKKLFRELLEEGNWPAIEAPQAQDAIRKLGHDGFYVAEGGQKNLAVYGSEQLKSATDNNGEFGLNIPKFREQKFSDDERIMSQANEETKEYLTIAARRLRAESIANREFERKVIEKFGIIDKEDFRRAIDEAEDIYAQELINPANVTLPAVEFAKRFVSVIDNIQHPVVKRWFSLRAHSLINGMSDSKKLSKKSKKEIQEIAGRIVIEVAQRGRVTGQENAAQGEYYKADKTFHFLVSAREVEFDMMVGLETQKDPETGRPLIDIINEQKEEIKKLLEQMPELSELSNLADDVNDVAMDDHADRVLSGRSTELDVPDMVTAEQLAEQKDKYEEIISKLEQDLKELNSKLSVATSMYLSEAKNRKNYAKQVADLRYDIEKRQKLIDRLKKSNAKLSSQNQQLREQIKKLREKVADLKDLNKALSKATQAQKEKLKNKLFALAASGKLDDPDFAAAFAEAFGIPVMISMDRRLIQHMASALKYFESNQHSEISRKYLERFNNYLEAASQNKWDAYRVSVLFHGLLYASALSSFGTQLTATVGSIITGVTESTSFAIANVLTNPKTALGSQLYGIWRAVREMKTALSKGAFDQRAYDNLGISWSGDLAKGGADLASVHIIDGFLRQLNRVKNDKTLSGKAKASIALTGSIVYLTTKLTYIMRFIDPVMTHSLSAYQQGMMDYQKAQAELGLKKKKGDMSVLEYLIPAISPSRWAKIDEMSGYSERNRKAAADQALKEIEELKAKGITIPINYARRRASEIMREMNAGQLGVDFDKLSRHWLMMDSPDGLVGYIWDRSKSALAISKKDTASAIFLKSIFSTTVFMFLRITAAATNASQSGIPLVGAGLAMWGYRKGENGWGLGGKYKGKLSDAIKDPSNTTARIAATRIGANVLASSIFAYLVMEMFDWYDDEPEDKTGFVYIPKVGWYKLDPNRTIDLTASGTGAAPKAQEFEEGRVNFGFKTKDEPGDDWSNWTSTRLLPHFAFTSAIIGRMADDAKGTYFDPKGLKKAAPAGPFQYVNEYMMSLGEFSFNTIGRTWTTAQYDKMKAAGDLLFRPISTVAQPAAVRDAIITAEDVMDIPRTGLEMREGLGGAATNAIMSLYGIDQVLSDTATDQFGIPVQTINPVSNWFTFVDGEKKKSQQSPEWNLAYRYINTSVPSTRSFRMEYVDRARIIRGELYPIPAEEKKVMSEYEKSIQLTGDEAKLASDYIKAKFRYAVLNEYDQIVADAELRMKPVEGKLEDPGEYVTAKFNDILKNAKEEVKNNIGIVANLIDKNKKQAVINSIIDDIKLHQEESNKKAKEIMSRGPLPKTGIGPDVRTRARFIFD